MDYADCERLYKMGMMDWKGICPECKKKVIPRAWENGKSGMYWCIECGSGNAGMEWIELSKE